MLTEKSLVGYKYGLSASRTSSCFRLMIWSSRARNRSFDCVVFASSAASSPPMHHRIMVRTERESKKRKLQASRVSISQSLRLKMSPYPKQTPTQALRGLFTDDYHGIPRFMISCVFLGGMILQLLFPQVRKYNLVIPVTAMVYNQYRLGVIS